MTTPTWSPATSLTVTPDKPSPHIEGTNVIFTALAAGPTPAVVYHYRFTLTSGGISTVVQDYSTNPMWALPSTAVPGAYTITVDVLSHITNPLPAPDLTTSLIYVVVVPVAPIGSFSPDSRYLHAGPFRSVGNGDPVCQCSGQHLLHLGRTNNTKHAVHEIHSSDRFNHEHDHQLHRC